MEKETQYLINWYLVIQHVWKFPEDENTPSFKSLFVLKGLNTEASIETFYDSTIQSLLDAGYATII